MSAGRLKDGRQRSVVSMVTMFLLALLWTLPTLGLLVTSFRSRDDIVESGWWTAILNPFGTDWTLGNYDRILDGRTGLMGVFGGDNIRQADLERIANDPSAPQELREAARFLLLSPPLPWFARPVYGLIALGGLSLVPRWARAELGLPSARPLARVLDGVGTVGGRLVTATIRWALDSAPPGSPAGSGADDDVVTGAAR